ncbi:hypothetical protein TNCT_63081 [Trichonephila clavata]|uniref:Uncharacterized protein n=1 Tax=Trichonephila clavata TaxID=2740835 RepID=A0A8X6FWI0_TRICU|nr:hypothetical protein TNCT_63081 [Trichonephila clavata]
MLGWGEGPYPCLYPPPLLRPPFSKRRVPFAGRMARDHRWCLRDLPGFKIRKFIAVDPPLGMEEVGLYVEEEMT